MPKFVFSSPIPPPCCFCLNIQWRISQRKSIFTQHIFKLWTLTWPSPGCQVTCLGLQQSKKEWEKQAAMAREFASAKYHHHPFVAGYRKKTWQTVTFPASYLPGSSGFFFDTLSCLSLFSASRCIQTDRPRRGAEMNRRQKGTPCTPH